MSPNRECGDRVDCREVRRTLYLYYDNELDRATMVSLYEHAERCPECWRKISYTTRLLTSVTLTVRRRRAPRDLRERILRRIGSVSDF